MGKQVSLWMMVAAACITGAACTVHQTSTPGLSGPSELSLALSMSATPDSVPLDGSQSAVLVEARDASGKPRMGLPLRLDIAVGATFQDCGTLSTRNVVTDANGHALAVYTAPGLPLPYPNCVNFVPGNSVTIVATPTGTDSITTNLRTTTIRLVPPSDVVILPPAPVPTAAFVVAAASPNAAVPAVFNASTSCGGPVVNNVCTGSAAITSYTWNFGDGTANLVSSSAIVTHTFFGQGVFPVTLTVTNDRGVSTSLTQSITVQAPAVPTVARFTLSPTAAVINQPVVLDASSTTTGIGVTILDYAWNFGDGETIVHTTNKTISHAWPTAGTFTISLRVTDNVGTASAASVATTTITIGVGGAGPTAVFTISQSPATVNQSITVDGGLSSPSVGSPNIVRYEWNFGDNTGIVGFASSTADHTYTAKGTYIITLTVTDTFGRQASTSRTIVVQ